MKKLLRRTIIGTMIYTGINLIVWFTRPVPFVCFGIYTVTYYMSALLWLWLARRDFKREVSVACPEIYRDWDQLMWGDIFTPAEKQREILKRIQQEMLKSPRRTNRTEDVVHGMDMGLIVGVGIFHFIVAAVFVVLMPWNGKID